MNFMGMGTLEVLVVLLIAFVFLGPERLVSSARSLGKFIGQIRDTTTDMSNMIVEDETYKSMDQALNDNRDQKTATEPQGTELSEDGPVPFARITNSQSSGMEEMSDAKPNKQYRVH